MSVNYKWDRRMLELASVIAGWSKDPSTKVGALVVNDRWDILSTGYNGFPRSVGDHLDRYQDRDTKLRLIMHAEANALCRCEQPTVGTTVFCTHYPCPECAKIIVQSGVKRVVCYKQPDYEARWAEQLSWTTLMFEEAKIARSFYDNRRSFSE